MYSLFLFDFFSFLLFYFIFILFTFFYFYTSLQIGVSKVSGKEWIGQKYMMTYFLEGSSKLDPKVHFYFVRAFYMNIAHVDIPSFLTSQYM